MKVFVLKYFPKSILNSQIFETLKYLQSLILFINSFLRHSTIYIDKICIYLEWTHSTTTIICIEVSNDEDVRVSCFRRAKYLLADDDAILLYLLDGDHYMNIKGNVVWKDMEMKKVQTYL